MDKHREWSLRVTPEEMLAAERIRVHYAVADSLRGPEPKDSKPTNPKDAVGTTKVPLGLMPDTAMIAGSMAFLEGAMKYGRYNWRIMGVRASVYYDALERHMKAWWNGEDVDPDSGLPHVWKGLACLAVLIDAGFAGKLHDDRPPSVAVGPEMEKLRPLMQSIVERYAHVQPHQYTIADKAL